MRRLSIKKALVSALFLSLIVSEAAYARCGSLEIQAHRGDSSHPENSVSAVVAALNGTHDAAEIDLQMLGDGKWVLHHDVVTGRVIRTGSARPVSMLSSVQWRQANLLDRKGNATTEPPPFWEDLVKAAAPLLREKGKRLNVEIKGKYECAAILQAASKIAVSVPTKNWMISSVDLDALRCVRRTYPDVYLGLVVAPEISQDDPTRKKASQLLEKAGQLGSKIKQKAESTYEQSLNRQHLTQDGLKSIVRELGNAGIHLDAATLKQRPSLLGWIKNSGLKVMVYGGFARSLPLAWKQELDGMIVDEKPSAVCS